MIQEKRTITQGEKIDITRKKNHKTWMKYDKTRKKKQGKTRVETTPNYRYIYVYMLYIYILGEICNDFNY